ncbi:Rne/Rng family ribonuclease [Haematomicrobium sanguinis]|uniref:Rne/Rng family ribonuclease n=1 Tax=Haematomicrobium sanguinis TaxID=479106 RepID=UPI00068AB8D5|nr:Rne/Rng family ribonuclease [Haematomicrobium sanguinis]
MNTSEESDNQTIEAPAAESAPKKRKKSAEDAPKKKPKRKKKNDGDDQLPDAASVSGGSHSEAAGPVAAESETAEPAEAAAPADTFSLLFQAPDLSAIPPRPKREPKKVDSPKSDRSDNTESDSAEDAKTREDSGRDGAERDNSSQSNKSRRQRRNARKNTDDGEGANGSGEKDAGAEGKDNGQDTPGEEGASETSSKRRRRRRRGDADIELVGGLDDDPPGTVTRVRAPRTHSDNAPDQVVGVKGSTRLEAKKQRRRESRDSGRRRQVITEAEFLARRESVDRQMIVRERADRIQIGVLEDGILAEHFVSKTQQDSLIGNVYLGKVQNVLPSMEAAFVDIGKGRNAVLYAGEVNWDLVQLDGKPRKIESALKSGDSVLVQVTKDPVGHKGARLTSQISLPGRYLVFVPGGSMTGISRKLPDVERNRLKKILKDRLPEDAGVIVRTAAEGASEEELTNDINRLRAQWEGIEEKANSKKTLAPELLHSEPDLTIKVVRDVFNEDFSKLIVEGDNAWDTIEAYVMYVAPDLVGRLEKWTGDQDVFEAKRIDEQIKKALDRKVYLPSGGSLVIDRTEAMTVVDVNTGKFTGSGGNLEETVTKNNLEAAEEVVRQLRLRDIGGIIVIDFIDMVLESNRDLVLRRLVECLGRDRTKHQVAEVTSLGLVQMTRKRMGTGLLEVFGEQCSECQGRGMVTYDEPVNHHRHVSEESPHQPRSEKPSRNERRRNRKSKDNAAEAPAEPQDAEAQAKAEAARAALANIAAATAHAHEHDHDGEQDGDSTEKRPVITFGDDVVEIPVKHDGETAPSAPEGTSDRGASSGADGSAAPDVTLETLSAAMGEREQGASGESGRPARKPRRRRAAGSAQGNAETAQVTTVQVSNDASANGTAVHTSKAEAPKAAEPKKDAAEPLIFGVGVPASEL